MKIRDCQRHLEDHLKNVNIQIQKYFTLALLVLLVTNIMSGPDAKNKTSSLIKLIMDSIAGNTPLHLAARAGKTTAVATLLHQGATAAMKVNYKFILMSNVLMGATMIIMEKMMMAVGKTVMMTMEGQLRL